MGTIADTLQAMLDELKRIDEESQRKTEATLRDLERLTARLEALQPEF